jgi:hypothetical protein
MHPLAFPARLNNSCAAQICEVARYLWLIRAEDFHEKAYANLAISNEVQ